MYLAARPIVPICCEPSRPTNAPNYPLTLRLIVSSPATRTLIDESAKRGWELFNAQARCNKCHALTETQRDVTFFTDNDFHNIGIIRHNVVALARQAEQLIKSGDTAAIDRAAIQTDVSGLGLSHHQEGEGHRLRRRPPAEVRKRTKCAVAILLLERRVLNVVPNCSKAVRPAGLCVDRGLSHPSRRISCRICGYQQHMPSRRQRGIVTLVDP